MSTVLDQVLNVPPALVYVLIAALVFGEDAFFVGFVVPGETAAILGGVAASRGNVHLAAVLAVVVGAAIAGDTVGYEVGRRFGHRVLRLPVLRRRAARLDRARELLARRGGAAVLLGRFTAFFRAVMPALAGTARMPYRRFLRWNAVGGLVWGTGATLVGYLAGNSYATVARTVGRGGAVVAAALALGALVAWRIHRHRHRPPGQTVTPALDES